MDEGDDNILILTWRTAVMTGSYLLNLNKAMIFFFPIIITVGMDAASS